MMVAAAVKAEGLLGGEEVGVAMSRSKAAHSASSTWSSLGSGGGVWEVANSASVGSAGRREAFVCEFSRERGCTCGGTKLGPLGLAVLWSKKPLSPALVRFLSSSPSSSLSALRFLLPLLLPTADWLVLAGALLAVRSMLDAGFVPLVELSSSGSSGGGGGAPGGLPRVPSRIL